MPQGGTLEVLPRELEWWGREAFEGKNHWYGALSAMVTPLSAEEAIWQPAPGRRCIWELTRHITFWRHYVVERLSGR
ncbi:MAG: DinB family protein, partial [Anaerolineales bacterium]